MSLLSENFSHLGVANPTPPPKKIKITKDDKVVLMYHPTSGRENIKVPAYMVEEKKKAGLMTMGEKELQRKDVTYINIVHEIARGLDGKYTVKKVREIDLAQWLEDGWEIYDETRHLPSNPIKARSYQAAEVESEYIVPEKVVVPEPPSSHAGRRKIH